MRTLDYQSNPSTEYPSDYPKEYPTNTTNIDYKVKKNFSSLPKHLRTSKNFLILNMHKAAKASNFIVLHDLFKHWLFHQDNSVSSISSYQTGIGGNGWFIVKLSSFSKNNDIFSYYLNVAKNKAKEFNLAANDMKYAKELLNIAKSKYSEKEPINFPEGQSLQLTSIPSEKDIALTLGMNEKERENPKPRFIYINNYGSLAFLIANPDSSRTFFSSAYDLATKSMLSESTSALGHFAIPVFAEISVRRLNDKLVFRIDKVRSYAVDGFDFNEDETLGHWNLKDGLQYINTIALKLLEISNLSIISEWIDNPNDLFDKDFKIFRRDFKGPYNKVIKNTSLNKLNCNDFGVVTEPISLDIDQRNLEIEIQDIL
ncbi:DUF6402 family protein [Candidatus Thiodiazotropha endoloripes]|uniref:Uncharacterized protein n=1 Tax=Candidatus Thiodiazotropha endoloripes TaxID=1818881 RepID=A0A1E2UTD3_9GAMM|nr:DUF6402 family protein [Candidatus Thiodiazotropha endoloripes]MCG7983768.1 DUF6402 family protein [Candidatus Thiodiazotropha lotti]ODB98023.1 hypothetical protein A3196_15410 [Candidatus Thiodiazotropha endoloripes]